MVWGNAAAGGRPLCESSPGLLGALGGGYGRCWGVVVSQAEGNLCCFLRRIASMKRALHGHSA